MNPLVILQVVSWNSSSYIKECISSLLAQDIPDHRFKIVVIDNASSDNTLEIIDSQSKDIDIIKLDSNLGFTGAHNLGLALAIKEEAQYICLINPDLTLEVNAISMLIEATKIGPKIGASTPLLYRSQKKDSLQTLDACGMELLSNLRHLDRGSNELMTPVFEKASYVFGGTGACLMLTRQAILDISYPATLNPNWNSIQFFDPLFFAYREDAEVALRLQVRGWRVRYEPKAVGHHVRQVLPENRSQTSDRINGLSARNRFLIQANTAPLVFLALILPLWMIRNILVISACFITERTSLPYLKELFTFRSQIAKKRSWNLGRKLTSSLTLSSIIEGANRSKEVALVKEETPTIALKSVHAVIVAFNSSRELLENSESVLISLNSLLKSKLTIFNNSPNDLEFPKVMEFISGVAPKYPNVSLEIVNSQTNLGFGGAANQALLNSNFDAYLVLNSDIGVEESSFTKLLKPFSLYKNLAALSPLIKDKETKKIQFQYLARRFPRFRDLVFDLIRPLSFTFRNNLETHRSYSDSQALLELIAHEQKESILEVEQISGACMLIRASSFNKLSGFDTQFYPAWYEDVDICKRISELDLTSAVTNSTTVSHRGAESLDSLSSRRFISIFSKNKVRYFRQHESSPFIRILAISLIYLEFILKVLFNSLKEYKTN